MTSVVTYHFTTFLGAVHYFIFSKNLESGDTETKEGCMMRNNLLNFAEFERETIAGRVADAYNTRGRETGFYQGGTMSFGYTTQRMTVEVRKARYLFRPNRQEH